MPSLTKKIIRGKPYYYLRECQRVEGKPKIVSTIYLGPPQSILDRLMRPEPAQLAIYEFGASVAVWDMAQAIDLLATIDRHVPKRASQGPSVGQYLLMAAFNRCIAPCSKTQIADWYQKTALRRLLPLSNGQLTSQRFWDNMERVSAKQIAAIERDITSTVVSRFGLDLHCLLFDATNFFTFLDSFNARAKLPQRGHSKEGRDNLRILGLALLVTCDGEIPLFHHTYAGNQHDSVTFQSVAEELLERCRSLAQGACDITLVFDKGNNSAENLEWVGNSPFHFVGSLVPTQHKDLLRISRKAMRRLDPTQLPAVWSYRTRKVVFGIARTILCTFNQKLFDSQTQTLSREIVKRRRRLQELRTRLENRRPDSPGKVPTVEGVQKNVKVILRGRHMADLFAAQVRQNRAGLPRLSFRFRDKAYQHLRSTLLGKTLLFTDRTDWSDEQIVLAYRAQHHVEADFRRLKDPHYLTFRPAFHWTDQKLKVHAFYCVLALLMLNLLRRKLAQAGIPLSIEKMMDSLTDIHEVTLLYPGASGSQKPFVRTVLADMDPTQRQLVKTLGLERYRSP
jgi:transposase